MTEARPGMTEARPGAAEAWPGTAEARPGGGRRRRGLLITGIVLVAVLVLCGGGGISAYLLLRDADGQGADDPKVAVTDFLRAVYTDRDAAAAEKLVCSEARDSAGIGKKVDEVKAYLKKYRDPRFTWAEPTVEDQNSDRAVVATKITMTTGDDQVAEQRLTLTVVHKTGWWVCEVEQR